ncbi:MAG TPA: alcohol dehydrogenase catalytic domain-containing protein [Spirochaetia bacterium]|nr:alcohol dehydrogenase catalytic domain-containing protein [Spirochaetia bacterium]
MSHTMRAVRFQEYGDAGKLIIESVPRPVPKANEILAKVHYAGVNPVDWKIRSGLYKDFMPITFPATPGRDFSGVVEEVGASVKHLSKGQRVFGPANGTYAEYVVVPEVEVCISSSRFTQKNRLEIPISPWVLFAVSSVA